ncbi:hypothetical protein [Treponema lecithinolyticum]|uniref:hypothetical protein n=1 Tax=Treponema lecithinolyticum TaxID=53418 RepID=UPI0036DE5E23
MRIRTFFGVPAFFVCAVFMQNLLCAQASRFTPNSFVRPDGQKKEPPVLEIAENPKTLPQSYRSIKLGMSVEETKKALKADSLFGYRGERDVSLLPGENRMLIETSSDGYLERCWFQFYEDKLYTIILNFNPEKMDFYSIFNRLLSKYGEPENLSPEIVRWQDERVLLSLERPISVKYIDREVFDKLADMSRVEQTVFENIRDGILEAL